MIQCFVMLKKYNSVFNLIVDRINAKFFEKRGRKNVTLKSHGFTKLSAKFYFGE